MTYVLLLLIFITPKMTVILVHSAHDHLTGSLQIKLIVYLRI